MALAYDGAIQRLIDAFSKLPGIGPKGAQRIAFYILGSDEREAADLADAITEVKAKVKFCEVCGNVCEASPCPVCLDPRRDHSIICVVEGPRDIKSIERTHEYNGLYHVLHGLISPMDGIGADQLCIKELLARLNDTVKEVIMATSPTVEGEATAMYIAKLIKPLGIKTTRLAYGLPVGSSLEYADETTLYRAMAGRGEM